jgi:hypothetical protein
MRGTGAADVDVERLGWRVHEATATVGDWLTVRAMLDG